VFRYFPGASCGNASDILGTWLIENGFGGVVYVWGVRGDEGEQSHGWLEVGGLVIDITSDQFEDGLEAVYVGPMTRFHESFKNQRRSVTEVAFELADLYYEMKESFGCDPNA